MYVCARGLVCTALFEDLRAQLRHVAPLCCLGWVIVLLQNGDMNLFRGVTPHCIRASRSEITAFSLMATTINHFRTMLHNTYAVAAQTVAWDDEAMFACVCDSSWEVGLGVGQRQQAEYFGADCSLRELWCRDLRDRS